MAENSTTTNPNQPGTGRIQVNPPVFFISSFLIVAFALLGALFPEQAGALFSNVQALIVADFGWLYVLAVAGFLAFVFFLMLSRYGDIRLGPNDAEAEYSYLSWFAMLFSAGMGIGLLFFGVAEPIQHFTAPPIGAGGTVAAAREALVLTFFHWGLHAWAIYSVVGLALAYFAFRQGLPLTIRSALFPLIGQRIHGPIGHAVDIFAVFGTMFGIATSLGLGALQVNAGFNYLFGVPISTTAQIILIAAITGLATISVMLGLDRGIRRLSELNITLAILLLLFVLVSGPTIFLLQAFVQNIGAYLGEVVPRTFRMYAYEPNPWLGDWTLFYWGWWIAWSPFVGMFIARISRGRTIREFVAGVLLVPVLFTFLWMTTFGNTAIWLEMKGLAPITQTVSENMPTALFVLLEELPLAVITSGLATLLVVTFFVTSADSGALVIDMITSGGAEAPPVWQRIFWAVTAGAIAAILLVAGGLNALQTAAIASALPFVVVMIFICYGLLRALQTEGTARPGRAALPLAPPPKPGTTVSWQKRLQTLLHAPDRPELVRYFEATARPALEAVAGQIRENGLAAEVVSIEDRLELRIQQEQAEPFHYLLRIRGYRAPSFSVPDATTTSGRGRWHYHALAKSSIDDEPHDITGYTREQLINDLLARFARHQSAQRLP